MARLLMAVLTGDLAPADIAAAKAAREVEGVDGGVGCLPSLGDVRSGGCHTEHTAAACHELTLSQRGAGMEDLRALRLCLLDSLDAAAFRGGARIPVRGHHHGQRGLARELGARHRAEAV